MANPRSAKSRQEHAGHGGLPGAALHSCQDQSVGWGRCHILELVRIPFIVPSSISQSLAQNRRCAISVSSSKIEDRRTNEALIRTRSPSCRHSIVEVMFDFAHLSDDSSALNQCLGCVSAGKNQLHVFGSILYQRDGSFQRNQIAVEAIVDLVNDHQIVLRTHDETVEFVHHLAERSLHRCHVFRNILALR